MAIVYVTVYNLEDCRGDGGEPRPDASLHWIKRPRVPGLTISYQHLACIVFETLQTRTNAAPTADKCWSTNRCSTTATCTLSKALTCSSCGAEQQSSNPFHPSLYLLMQLSKEGRPSLQAWARRPTPCILLKGRPTPCILLQKGRPMPCALHYISKRVALGHRKQPNLHNPPLI